MSGPAPRDKIKKNCKHWEMLLHFTKRSVILNPVICKATEIGTCPQVQNMKGEKNMAFNFDELKSKAKSVANKAADRTKDAAELVKINVAISAEQKEIDKNYRAIGEWFVNEYEGEIPEAVRETVEAVNASKEKIAGLEASKPVREEAAGEEEESSGKKCPICGAESDSKFCPQCGAPMGDEE